MLEVFTEHGIPNKIRCDHGSNFTSLDFASFVQTLAFHFPLVVPITISQCLLNVVLEL